MSSSVYTNKLACSLNDLRKGNQLCDIIITVNGRDFNAHKNVLAARSSYFLAMFTSGFREASESKVNIDGKPEIFKAILDYVYTGTVKLSGETVCELLEMACYMQLKEASQHIANFIHHEISWDIPIGDVYKISEIASCHEHLKFLISVCDNHMCKSYKQLKSSDVFLQHASVEFLMKLLTRPDLSRKNEEKEVLELVVKWLKHDFENRREFAPSLLRKVRLGLVQEESRTELLSEEILGIPECKQILDSVTSHQQSGISKSRLALMYPSLFSTRSTITAIVRAAAPEYPSSRRTSGTQCTSFEYFDINAKQWKQIPSITTLRWVPSLIVIDDKLHAIGGLEKYVDDEEYRYMYDRSDSDSDIDYQGYTTGYRTDFEIYDADQNRWRHCPAMKYARANPWLVYQDNCIYAIGGTSHDGGSSKVECFDMTKKQWKDIAPLPDTFELVSAVAFQGSILVYGTVSTYLGWEILVYSPSTGKWVSKYIEPNFTSYLVEPFIFVHRDQCYRVGVKKEYILYPSSQGRSQEKVVVNRLSLKGSRRSPVSYISLGEEILQDSIPTNKAGCFSVGEEMFVSAEGVVHKIGMVKEEQDKDNRFNGWQRIRPDDNEKCSNTITFTCDTKL